VTLGLTTWMFTVAVWVSEPHVPVTITAYVPAAALDGTAIDKVVVAPLA